jgi:hypothetical protein
LHLDLKHQHLSSPILQKQDISQIHRIFPLEDITK